MENDLRSIIDEYIREISHFSQMQVFATSEYQKDYFQRMMDERREMIINNIMEHMKQFEENYYQIQTTNQQPDLKQYTLEELATFHGSQGRPAYVAVNGTIYDVSLVGPWAGGTHFGLYAGQDLSAQFNGCHSGIMEILRKVPIVGLLRNNTTAVE